VAGVLEDLCLGRAPGGRFLFGGFGAPSLHLALVKAHGQIVIGFLAPSTLLWSTQKNLRVVPELDLTSVIA
jgi:hypothetical protein